jgi:hypothetical protein
MRRQPSFQYGRNGLLPIHAVAVRGAATEDDHPIFGRMFSFGHRAAVTPDVKPGGFLISMMKVNIYRNQQQNRHADPKGGCRERQPDPASIRRVPQLAGLVGHGII